MSHPISFHIYNATKFEMAIQLWTLSSKPTPSHSALGFWAWDSANHLSAGSLDTLGMDAGGRLEAGVERGDLFPVILVGPGCNQMYPYKKKAGRSNLDTQRRSHTKRRGQHDPGSSEWADAGTGPGMPSEVTASGAGRGEERVHPRVLGGSTVLPTAWLSDSVLQN